MFNGKGGMKKLSQASQQGFFASGLFAGLGALLLLISSPPVLAQESAQKGSRQLDSVPDTRELAAALSDPASREDALLTFITLSHLLQSNPSLEQDKLESLEDTFLEDRAWLDRLAMRYLHVPMRSTVFDPAAWLIQQELGQQEILPSPQVSPMGPPYAVLLEQLFDRSDERLAAAFLPEALFTAEFIATPRWQLLLEQAEENAILLDLIGLLNPEWFEPWTAAEPPAPVDSGSQADFLEQALLSLEVLMSSAILQEPPDDLHIKRLRFGLLTAMPGMTENQARTASQILRLTSAINGLYDNHFLEFIQSLVWVASDLLDVYERDPNAWSPMPLLMSGFLPALSSSMGRSFSDVDARFNANLAATFDVVQELSGGELRGGHLERLQTELADTVTQLVLQVPDMSFYYDQPVRSRISEEIDICISVAAVRDDNGQPQMSRQQFDGCIASMVQMAQTQVRRAELAGDPRGPFGSDQLQRELELTPWQRINYAIGYLHERSNTACPMPASALPNPLEWSALATLMVWFSSQSPVYMQTPENEALVASMRQIGLDLLRTMSEQVDCINGAGGSYNDLIGASLQQYQNALVDLVGGIRATELNFREARLRPGADVVLGGNVDQSTSYRTPGLMIGPCDAERVCEMDLELEATRALVGLFPDEYLLADQVQLGTVEICYDNMQWIDRRAERVRRNDPNVANYYGHLSFDLVGRFYEGENISPVFGSNFVSPDEYHYLIAASSDEVLNDGCPTEWVGTRVMTERSQSGGINIVPNRLTYLAAARKKPSEIINGNWSRGAEWRDWFVTGIGVSELEFAPDPGLHDRLGRHLRALYQSEQQMIYSHLLRPPAGPPGSMGAPLYDLMADVTMYKSLLRNQLNLFYPEFMLDSDEIRSAVEGLNGLLDQSVVRRFQENNVAVAQIHDIGLDRLQGFKSSWQRQPEMVVRSGSVSASMAHAVARLNTLYRDFFALDVPAPTPVETEEGSGSAEPAAEPETQPEAQAEKVTASPGV